MGKIRKRISNFTKLLFKLIIFVTYSQSTNSIRILPLYKRGANLSRYSLYSKATIIKNSEPSLFIPLKEDASSRKENEFSILRREEKGMTLYSLSRIEFIKTLVGGGDKSRREKFGSGGERRKRIPENLSKRGFRVSAVAQLAGGTAQAPL